MDKVERGKITATFQIVTPMFIGDANQKVNGIPAPAVKGAIRFWWRALNWGRIRDNASDDDQALKKMHHEESVLFGSADGNIGQSKFLLRVSKEPIQNDWPNDWPKSSTTSGYLGMGLWETGKKDNPKPAREYIPEKKHFSIELLYKLKEADCSEAKEQLNTAVEQVNDAIKAWGFFGGLGGRSRRGFGAIAIEKLNNSELIFADVPDYKTAVSQLIEKYRLPSIGQPPFTALCKESLFSMYLSKSSTAREAHGLLGGKYKEYRSREENRGPIKRVLGMPYDYPGASKLEKEARRASPLLFHIHPIGEQFVAAILYLPAVFHRDVALVSDIRYEVARDFLTCFHEMECL
jgi:CRISPR-associated protein Cmr1